MRRAYFNGTLMNESDVVISIEDRAFKYGDMVFDVARTFDGEAFKLERHIERLMNSMRYMRIGSDLGADTLLTISEDVLRANQECLGADGDYWLRQYVSRGLDPLSHDVRDVGAPTILVRCEPLDFSVINRLHTRGIDLATSSVQKVPPTCVDGKAKIGNYANLILAELQVPRDRAALLLDGDGYLAEGFGWNLFIVRDDAVFTPSLGSILPGISRETVIELCGMSSIKTVEQPLTVHDLYTASEAFITSTSFCIAPVRSADGIDLPGSPGPVTQRLIRLWCDLVRFDFVAQARTLSERSQPRTVESVQGG